MEFSRIGLQSVHSGSHDTFCVPLNELLTLSVPQSALQKNKNNATRSKGLWYRLCEMMFVELLTTVPNTWKATRRQKSLPSFLTFLGPIPTHLSGISAFVTLFQEASPDSPLPPLW